MNKLIPLLLTLLLAGCLDTPRSTTLQDSIDTTTATVYPRFDPSNGIIPYPNNLLFSGSSDGTLNIPLDPSASDAAVKTALNALDGFSTIAPITVDFSTSIDAETLVGGDSVRVFEVTLSGIGGAVTGIVAELNANSDYAIGLSSLDSSQSTLVITPLKALKPATSYLVVLTNAIKDKNGTAATAEIPYIIAKNTSPLVNGDGISQLGALDNDQAAAFEPIRQLVNAAEAAVTAFDSSLERSDIVLSWTFTTQSVGQVLTAVRNKVQSDPAPASTLTSVNSPLSNADLYAGTLSVPYYLAAPSDDDPTAPLTSHWQGQGGSELTALNTSPVAKSTQTIPLLVSIPKTGSAPWPVVIYQHGITTNRATLLAVADTLAQAGFAAVAIDMPLHGLTGNETDGTEAFYMAGLERTFDLDLVDNTTGAPGSDGITDASGTHFINLASLLTSRDNLRQAVADLFALTRALDTMDYDNDGTADFDTSKIRFLGHSLGAMVGGVFLALETNVGAATLAMPGGGIVKLLDGSSRFGPRIAAGLAASGVNKGTPDYEAFLASAQTVLDSADPLNYAADTANNRGIHLIEIIGGAGSPTDQVIPNNVLNIAGTVPSPTAGTDPLATAMGLTKVSSSTTGNPLKAWVRLTAGHHGSLLTPDAADGSSADDSAAAISEIQQQLASFLASNGSALTITNPDIIEQQ